MADREWADSVEAAMEAITRTFDCSVVQLRGEHSRKRIVDVHLPGGEDE